MGRLDAPRWEHISPVLGSTRLEVQLLPDIQKRRLPARTDVHRRISEHPQSAAARRLLPASDWTSELVAFLGVLPEAELFPALRQHWAQGSVQDAIARQLARSPQPEDRARFITSLGSFQPAVVEIAAKSLTKLSGEATPGELAAALTALRRQCAAPKEKAARTALAAGQLDDAMRLFERVASQGDAAGRAGVGEVYLRRRDYEKAREQFAKAPYFTDYRKLFEDKVSLGGDASVAAGPVGRSASAATDAVECGVELGGGEDGATGLDGGTQGAVVPDQLAPRRLKPGQQEGVGAPTTQWKDRTGISGRSAAIPSIARAARTAQSRPSASRVALAVPRTAPALAPSATSTTT